MRRIPQLPGFSLRAVRRLCVPGLVAASLLTLGCDSDDTEEDDGATLPDGCDFFVEPGADDQTAIQEAFIEVETGQTVCLASGQFDLTRQLSLDADGVTIEGAGSEDTILDFSEQNSGGNGMLVTGNDVVLVDFQVKNTPGDGIRADQVENITFMRTYVGWDAQESTDNGAYGLYPVQSNGVTIQDTKVWGSRDAGVYVGQSTAIVVSGNEAYGNVAGIEVENSTDAQVFDNHAHDNTAGILVFNLPGLDIKDGKRSNVYDNVVENNNTPNFGEAGTVVAQVPPGIGMLVLAADNNEFANNEIRGNDSVGIGIIYYADALFGDPNDDAFDIYAEGNWVHDNTFASNGANPDELVQLLTDAAMPSPDMMVDGCSDAAKDNGDGGLDNCFSDNGGATFMQVDMCSQQADGKSTDVATATCMHAPLPRQ